MSGLIVQHEKIENLWLFVYEAITNLYPTPLTD
jgi:hypothetical protein